jgi:hypothetical protein
MRFQSGNIRGRHHLGQCISICGPHTISDSGRMPGGTLATSISILENAKKIK